LSTFPKQIGAWVGKEERFDQKIYELLGVDDSLLCRYKTPDGRHLQLYVGFYQSQREGDLIHSPKNCMPGAGWNIVRTSIEEIVIPGLSNRKIKTIKLILKKGSQQQIVLYWFQSRGRFIASEYMQKVYLVIDSVRRHRTDGSFVRIIAPISGQNLKEVENYMKSFVRVVVPILQNYIPS
jgi:EpsI family protein